MELKQTREGLYYRVGTSDEKMLKESNIKNASSDYSMLKLFDDMVIMDIGANVGGFAARLASKAKRIVCYEPDPSNFEVLKMNTEKFPNVELVHGAIIKGNDPTVTFYMTKSKSANCSGSVYRGRRSVEQTVPAINFASELERIQPNFLKIDIEGSEYDLLTEDLPECVKEVIIEIHHSTDKLTEKYKVLLAYFERQFGPEVNRHDVVYFNRHNCSVVYFKR